jgi:hypothetical protein
MGVSPKPSRHHVRRSAIASLGGSQNETKILFPSQYGTYILFLIGVRRDGSAPAKEDGVRLRIIGAARIGAIHGGDVAVRCESAPGAS